MADALDYIQGSQPDFTRPWLRLEHQAQPSEGPFYGNFLIVAGRKMAVDDAGRIKLPTLACADQALLDAWRFDPSSEDQPAGPDTSDRHQLIQHQ